MSSILKAFGLYVPEKSNVVSIQYIQKLYFAHLNT